MSIKLNLPSHKQDDKCPVCDKGTLILKVSNFKSNKGKNLLWLSCSEYPNCKYTVGSKYTKENSNPITKWESLKRLIPHFSQPRPIAKYQVIGKSGRIIERNKLPSSGKYKLIWR